MGEAGAEGMKEMQASITELYRDRPRYWDGRIAVALALGITALAWLSSGVLGSASLDPQRLANIASFAHEALPQPLVPQPIS